MFLGSGTISNRFSDWVHDRFEEDRYERDRRSRRAPAEFDRIEKGGRVEE
jgi:hypothetical protein